MKYEILKKEEVFSDFFQIELTELKHEKFNSSDWAYIKRYNLKRPAAAAVLVENRDADTVVLTEQFRYSSLSGTSGDGWSLEIPAGLLESGEALEACAQREVLEETGYRLGEMEYLRTYFSSIGFSSEQVHLYYALVGDQDKVEAGGGVKEESEDIRVLEIPLREAFSMLAQGRINDGKTIIALQWLALMKLGTDHASGLNVDTIFSRKAI